MGLPDNRDIEPIRDDSIGSYNNDSDFVINQIEENEMEVDEPSDLNNGYLRLQQMGDQDEYQPANDSDSSDSDEDEDEDEYAFTNVIPTEPPSGVPAIVSSDSELQVQVWNAPRTPTDTIELNSEKTQQILQAMSKFSLPNIPEWATQVDPGELIQRIRNKEGVHSDKK